MHKIKLDTKNMIYVAFVIAGLTAGGSYEIVIQQLTTNQMSHNQH